MVPFFDEDKWTLCQHLNGKRRSFWNFYTIFKLLTLYNL